MESTHENQMLIDQSEKHYKKLYGEAIFQVFTNSKLRIFLEPWKLMPRDFDEPVLSI